MSSDRPGRPADVVPGDDGGSEEPAAAASPDPRGAGSSAPVQPRSGGRRGRRREKKKGSLLREMPVLLLIALVLALLVKTFFVQAFFIPSGSMETTLHGCPGCTGDRVLVNKVPYWFGSPEPGDIVVFKGPDTWAPEVTVAPPSNWFSGALLWLGRQIGVAPPSEDDFVKRVIATGGQTVQCCDAQGRVVVDGKPLDEPYAHYIYPYQPGLAYATKVAGGLSIDPRGREFGPVKVPDGNLWVMGDNRNESADSRAHVDDEYSGTVPIDAVRGKAVFKSWPPNRIGPVKSQ